MVKLYIMLDLRAACSEVKSNIANWKLKILYGNGTFRSFSYVGTAQLML